MPYADISKPPAPLPAAKLRTYGDGLSMQPPLTRLGSGPGLIILTTEEMYDDQVTHRQDAPTALLKWAEEGYTVFQISASAISSANVEAVLTTALEAFNGCDACQPKSKVGLICYMASLFNTASKALDKFPSVVAGVVYADADGAKNLHDGPLPLLAHVVGPTLQSSTPSRTYAVKSYNYATTSGQWFSAGNECYHYASDAVAHTRNLQFLKPKMGGPYFDLEAIWDEHTSYEFADRSVEHTMSTMVQEPYVNHIPTLTGGIGRAKLTDFYRDHFIFKNSADTELELTSRTIGIDRVIDEFVYKFTHDREIDWLLPGVPPTNKKAEVPFVGVVNIRGDRLYHEHIWWDQGTALRQLGLLPEYLPFPYPVSTEGSAETEQVEYRVPVFGATQADKLRNRKAVPSNEAFSFSIRDKQHINGGP